MIILELFVNWTNQKIKDTFVERNAFNFKYIKAFQKEMADRPGPMVVFATPGMLHAGQSLEIFKAWYVHFLQVKLQLNFSNK